MTDYLAGGWIDHNIDASAPPPEDEPEGDDPEVPATDAKE